MATVKLTKPFLNKIIAEERAKLGLTEDKGLGAMEDVTKRAKATDEVDADEYGTGKSLEKEMDHMKALKIKENAFKAALKKLREAKKMVRAKRLAKVGRGRKVTMSEAQLVRAIKATTKKRAVIRKLINNKI